MSLYAKAVLRLIRPALNLLQEPGAIPVDRTVLNVSPGDLVVIKMSASLGSQQKVCARAAMEPVFEKLGARVLFLEPPFDSIQLLKFCPNSHGSFDNKGESL